MFVIIEGVDRAGKSTLVEQVYDEILLRHPHDEIKVIHSGPLKGDALNEYAFAFDGYRPGTGRHVIMDRAHLGERVYGPLWRGNDKLGTSRFRFTELYLAARGAVMVVLRQSRSLIVRRMRDEGEDLLAESDVQKVLDCFRYHEKGSTLSLGSIATTRENMRSTVLRIVKGAERRDAECAPLTCEPGYIGHAYPRTLLVGDRHGGRPPHRSEAAFIPVNGNSAEYLWKSLPDPLWRTCGAINGHEAKDLEGLVALLRRPAVIALGTNAAVDCERAKVAYAKVPHPQWQRRFRNSEPTEYGALISSLATA